MPAELAAKVTKSVSLPVIGIGAGKDCNGQILVLQDILGITAGEPPPFVKNFMLQCSIQDAVKKYIYEVKAGLFP